MRPMPELAIETMKVDELVPYAGNAKLHPPEQVDQIAASIEEFGNCDPIAVWTNDVGELVIVEGHGRYAALRKLGITEVPIIRLDHLSDEQRRAYGLVHNKLTINSDFDFDLLANELDMVTSIDMEDFGFVNVEMPDIDGLFVENEEPEEEEKPKTIVCPHCGEAIEL